MKFVAIVNNQQIRLTGESANNQSATCAVLGGVCFESESEAIAHGQNYSPEFTDKFMVFPFDDNCEFGFYPKFVTVKNGIAISAE